MSCSPPASSVRGIFQARIPEWVAISFSRGPSWPRDWTCSSCVSCIGRQILYHWATREDPVEQKKIIYQGDMLLRLTVYKNTDGGQQSLLPLPPGGGHSPTKSVPRCWWMFTITHALTWRGVQWTAGELEVWTELRWSCYPGNTWPWDPTLHLQGSVSWCSRRNSGRSAKYNAWGSVSGREMHFESEEGKHIDKEDISMRTEPKGKPAAFKLQTSENALEGWRVLFIRFLFCFRVAWSRMWCKTGKSKLQGCSFLFWETHHLWLRYKKQKQKYLWASYNFCFILWWCVSFSFLNTSMFISG